MQERLEAARDRVAALVETVALAQARREALRGEGADAAAQRAADAELGLQRAALEVARDELARIEREAKAQATRALDAELQAMAAHLLRDVDAVLAGALVLRRSLGLARARGLQTPPACTLPDAGERLLAAWRWRLRRIAGERESGRDFDDAA